MHSSPNRRVQHDFPKPDTGLAEWTSKIKAMQRQVDADEEAEQQRLEEEIAASRLARLRRSHATGDSSQRSDLSKASPSSLHDNYATGLDRTIPIAERYTNQLSTHRMPSTRNSHGEEIAPTRIHSSDDTKPPPISLAAFMGGRATGPRLNRHAPQQDAHDPTQFHQREDNFVPHPVFGKGGVAMPGMADRGSTIIKTSGQVIDNPSNDIAPAPSVSRKESPLTGLTAKLEQAKPIIRAPNSRERTTSTSALPSSSPSAQVKHDLTPSRSTADLKTAKQDRTTGSHGLTTAAVAKPVERPVTPYREHGDASKPLAESSIMTPTLARPIYPQPRSSIGPQMPISNTPSPAFLRPPPQKDPSPSISRLQGRGFVQSMVNVSRQLESSPTLDGDSEHSTKANGRRTSVLDRWKPDLSASSSPPVSPTPKPMRRSVTVDPVSATSDRQHAPIADSPKRLKPVRSSSSLPQTNVKAVPPLDPPSDVAAGVNNSNESLGSATTLLVYKPMSLSPTPAMDEFGIKSDSLSNSGNYKAGKLSASSGKPLSHPTKDRARKPLKSRQLERPINRESPIPAHPGPTSVTLSDSPVMPLPSPTPLTKVMNTSKIGTVPSRLVDVATADPESTCSVNVPEQPSNNMIRRALPGMAVPERASVTAVVLDEPLADKGPVSNEGAKPSSVVLSGEGPLVLTPSRHFRIPSTGNRATVMDVAQALNTQFPELDPASEAQLRSSLPAEASHLRNLTPPAAHMEKRKSSQEKYSAIMLPPLKEEATPTASPAGTLSHATSNGHQQKLVDETPIKVDNFDGDVFHPSFNIEPLIKPPVPFSADLKSETISVDVMLVTGTTATVIPQHQAIFYDTELLVIVYRSKSRTTSLVSTIVWAWRGKRCILGEKENNKVQELGKRYGTVANIVQQHSEPPQLVHVLGGQLAIRQGIRARWTAENTTMHLIRSKGGMLFVDEHDLSIQYLCSGFSYCLSILGAVYVWYGCGSTPRERQAALEYARSLEVGGDPAIELYENEKNNDEMFWMILGDEDYANADYWKWRNNSPLIDARIWRVNAHTDENVLLPVDTFSEENFFHSCVYILDCVWELYVMVGSNARGHRQDIGLGVEVALELSARVAPARPYAPTVHVLMLPSQLPRDLRLNFRDLDELSINHGDIPDHMNILFSTDALDHLQKNSWDKTTLQDQTTLPLGVGP